MAGLPLLSRATSVSVLMVLCNTAPLFLSPGPAQAEDLVQQGRSVAFDRNKGNCLACHAITGGDLPGDVGPPLIAMRARFPDSAKLRAQIADASANNPDTIMPPFGRHSILSDTEIDAVVAFLYTL